jgi:hypothetical protein
MQNSILTALLKKTILDLELIDTGALYNSIQVSVKYTNNGIDIIVNSEDYIKYLVEPYNIVEVFFNQPGFEAELEIIFKPFIETKFQEALNGKSQNLNKINLQILFNS